MTSRKKPGVAFWATVGLVVVFVGYPLSLFPIAWLDNRDMLPEESIRGKIAGVYCAPIRWANDNDNGPEWIVKSLDWIMKVSSPADDDP